MNLATIGPLLLAVAAFGGLILAVLRSRREDDNSIVKQHAQVLEGMRTLMDEREEDRDRDRRELVQLRARVEHLENENAQLRARLRLIEGGTR